MSGDYVVVEGVDGSGKSTCAEGLATRLGAGLVREPNDDLWTGEAVREALDRHTASMTDALLFMADRAENIDRYVRRPLEIGSDVVSDRSHISTYAYQAHNVAQACGLSLEGALDRIDDMYRGWNLEPDAVVLLECPVETALERCDRADKHEDRMTIGRAADVYDMVARRRDDVVRVRTDEHGPRETVEAAADGLEGVL